MPSICKRSEVLPSTIHPHLRTARKFLSYVGFDKSRKMLARLDASDLERFVRGASSGISRATLQHTARVRCLLRFLAIDGTVSCRLGKPDGYTASLSIGEAPSFSGLGDGTILSESIQRTHPKGRRDYAMFFLIAAYGLRSSEVVGLTLDNICWRSMRIQISQTKTRSALELPLTDEVAGVLISYLRKVPRAPGYRQLFLRMYAPSGPLKPHRGDRSFSILGEAKWFEHPVSGSPIAVFDTQYAVNLLRQGTPLKTIGDLFGHRSAESTSVYLRLATEDLRGVGLTVPVNGKKVGVRL